jgi:hypothetical protein
MADCNICCEKLNRSNRKEIICVFCNFSTCRNCFQKYILDTIEDPNCMNCKKIFNRTFINENCTIIFINTTFKKHRQDVLFNREKAMLLETQPYVELEIQKRNMMKEIDKIRMEKLKLETTIQKLNIQMNRIYQNISTLTIGGTAGSSTDEERKKFIRKCPMEDCRGFLSTRWKCGSCETQICKDCNEEQVSDHICKPENVASMELLNKDTKSCPECGTMIYKIAGCSHMFCTECKCSWDWNTHSILKGTNTNPHYYEFVRNNGIVNRNLNDIPCGGMPDVYTIRNIFTRFSKIDIKTINTLYALHNCITHIERIEITHVPVVDQVVINRPLRVNYLMNNLTEDLFKQTLQIREKVRDKHTDFNNIYQMFVNVASDIFTQIYQFLRSKTSYGPEENLFINTNYTILINLTIYFNENVKKIGKMYNCVYPGFTDTCTWVNNLETYIKSKVKVNLKI